MSGRKRQGWERDRKIGAGERERDRERNRCGRKIQRGSQREKDEKER